MISVENFVFSPIAVDLRAQYPGIQVVSEELRSPAFENSSIAVSILEASNSIYQKMRTTTIENAVQTMFEVNVYSNDTVYKKIEAKEVMAFIDERFENLGFTRIMCTPMANLQDATIYRITARYEGVVMPEYGVDETIYRIYTH